MGGCNCKKTNKRTNPLDQPDWINHAKQIYQEVIQGRTAEEMDDFDKATVIQTYQSLYPLAKYTPSVEDAIVQIKFAIERYDVKYRR